LSSGGGDAGVVLDNLAPLVGIADVIPAETATLLFNTSRLVHLRIFPLPYSRMSAE
jgi:hypothetical protein